MGCSRKKFSCRRSCECRLLKEIEAKIKEIEDKIKSLTPSGDDKSACNVACGEVEKLGVVVTFNGEKYCVCNSDKQICGGKHISNNVTYNTWNELKREGCIKSTSPTCMCIRNISKLTWDCSLLDPSKCTTDSKCCDMSCGKDYFNYYGDGDWSCQGIIPQT